MAGTAPPPPPPRLCHIRKVADFDGYGFNLHAEKNKPGQFVGKIDSGSPAEAAGLREGDREDGVIMTGDCSCLKNLNMRPRR